MRGVCVLAFVCGCAQGAGTDDTQPAATGGPGGTLGGGDGSWASSDAPSGSDPDTGTSFDSGTDAEVLKPAYLPDGRTYDQDLAYIEWSGNVSFIMLEHKDGTSLPASEGGASCASGCTEQVTRIGNGGMIWGRFVNLESFNVQAASTDDPSAGTVTVEACDQVIASVLLQVGSSGVPGFNNFPVPAWPVPTADDCIWRIHATGGYVDVRAVTVEHRSSGPENPI
jgi:hypothetical protein